MVLASLFRVNGAVRLALDVVSRDWPGVDSYPLQFVFLLCCTRVHVACQPYHMWISFVNLGASPL